MNKSFALKDSSSNYSMCRRIKTEVFKIERMKCMCGQHNRKCNYCECPFEVDVHSDNLQIHNCPRCGNPFSTKTTKAEDTHLRAKFNLIP